MDNKLFNSELKGMDVLWDGGDKSAKEISDILGKEIGWNKNTTYTVIKKCIAKGAIERSEPGFICHAAIDRETVRQSETEELLQRLFGGSSDLLFASMISSGKLTKEQVQRLNRMVDELADGETK